MWLTEQVRLGRLVPWTTELEHDEHTQRSLHITARARAWVEALDPERGSPIGSRLTLAQQLSNIAHEFITGRRLIWPQQFHKLAKAAKAVTDPHVWELKTDDLRLFGWFVAPNCFVVDAIDIKDRIVASGLYAGYVAQTAQARQSMGCVAGLFMETSEPNDVVPDSHQP